MSLIKALHYPGIDDDGNILVQALTPGSRRGFIKTAGALHPQIAQYIRGIKKDPRFLWVLVNALSAGEYWGSNINGDWFPEEALAHEGNDYGYKTFYNAGIFVHHQNKDISKTIGKIVLAIYNYDMHRVELIHRIDRALAREHGADDVVQQLDAGQHPATSMGCKVPYDCCAWCGNISKTRQDYCLHALKFMNYIADRQLAGRFGVELGSKMYVINTRPKFFDDSYVVVGADQTSYAIQKVASAQAMLAVDLAKIAGWSQAKVAALAKAGEKGKLADILKQVPSMGLKTMSALQRAEKRLPAPLLNRLGQGDISSALGTAAGMGILLSPGEFQRLILMALGRRGTADDLDDAHCVFPKIRGADTSMDYGHRDYSSSIRNMLMPMFQDRSAFGPVVRRRTIIIIRSGAKPRPERKEVKYPDAEKISAAYNGYLSMLPQGVVHMSKVAQRDPHVMKEVLRAQLDPLEKTASVGAAIAGLLGLLPVLYLYGRSIEKRQEAGEPVSALQRFIKNNPEITSSVLLGASLALTRM